MRIPSESELHRLLPLPATTTTIVEACTATRPPHADRPFVGVCMVSSLDGSIAVDGASGALGNDHDLEVLLTLRYLSDMVIVGAGTVRDEGYGPPRRAGQRVGVVTNRGRVDLDAPLFTSGAGFVITTETADVDESRVDVVRAGRDTVDLATALGRLHQIDDDVEWVQAEGGAMLNGSLLDADLIDELSLTMSPHLVGGEGPRVTSGAGEAMRRFELAHLLADDEGYVFTRWRRAC